MRIGIDVDGVLTDLENWQLEYGSKYFYEKYNIDIEYSKEYEINDIFNVQKPIYDDFWKKHLKEYFVNIKCRYFASEVIEKLINQGHEIYIITARKDFLSQYIPKEEAEQIALDWLNKNDIKYNKIIFSSENKLETCQNNNIDLMIEDSPDNVNNISKYIPTICFNARYNDNCTGRYMYRCYSWYDVLCYIENIKNKS